MGRYVTRYDATGPCCQQFLSSPLAASTRETARPAATGSTLPVRKHVSCLWAVPIVTTRLPHALPYLSCSGRIQTRERISGHSHWSVGRGSYGPHVRYRPTAKIRIPAPKSAKAAACGNSPPRSTSSLTRSRKLSRSLSVTSGASPPRDPHVSARTAWARRGESRPR